MASPFALFRKNQKIMIAILAVLAMFVFVVADSLPQLGGGGGGSDPVVVESKYFTLRESEIDRALNDRQIVLQYITETVAGVFEQQQLQELRTQLPQLPIEQLRQFVRSEQMVQQAEQYAVGRFGPATENSVVDTAVLAAEAERMGMVAADPMVEEFIFQSVFQRMVPPEQMTNVYKSMSARRNGRLTYKQLLGAFRNEMLAWTMQTMIAGDPVRIATPLDRWNYYLRKRCLATAEVLPVRTKEDVIDKGKVREPSDAELAAFFNEYRYDEPVPGSPDPGFKMPQKAMFQYAAADESRFFEPDKITDEQIAAHYDANKARYPYEPEDMNEPVKPEPTGPAKVEPDCGAEGDATADEALDAEAFDADAAGSANDSENACADEPTAQLPLTGPTAAPAATPTATGDVPPTPVTPATAAGTATSPASTPAPLASPTATGAAATATTATPDLPGAPLPPAPLPTENWLLPDDVRVGRNPQHEPLWKVSDKIREELARKAADDKSKELLEKLRVELVNAALKREVKSDQLVFDDAAWQTLLEKYPGLTGTTTSLMSAAEANLAAENPGFFKATVGGEPIVRSSFSDSAIYAPKEAIEIPEFSVSAAPASKVRYLFWKVKNVPARVPELQEIRAEVAFAWKTREARVEARKLAEELAGRARASSQSLAEQFPDRDVTRTNAFAWYETDLSGGFNPQPTPTRISRVDGVEDAGPEFMQTVFGLDIDQVGTAMNHPESICYVIRVTSQTPTRSQLYDAFMVDNFQTYMQFAQGDVMQNGREALQSLLADADIDWKREPRSLR